MKKIILLLIISACTNIAGKAQDKKLLIGDIVGDWRGSSLCQVRNSPCHDEVVVYHISRGNTADSLVVQADKIVNGVEEDMGTLHFRIDFTKNEIESSDYGKWVFQIKDSKMDGTLMVKNQLYRIIKLAKSN